MRVQEAWSPYSFFEPHFSLIIVSSQIALHRHLENRCQIMILPSFQNTLKNPSHNYLITLRPRVEKGGLRIYFPLVLATPSLCDKVPYLLRSSNYKSGQLFFAEDAGFIYTYVCTPHPRRASQREVRSRLHEYRCW